MTSGRLTVSRRRLGLMLAAVAAGLTVALVVVACTGQGSRQDPRPPASSAVGTVRPDRASVVKVSGVTISVPIHSVAGSGKIAISPASAPALPGSSVVHPSAVHRIELTGTQLTGEATLTMSVPAPAVAPSTARVTARPAPTVALLAYFDDSSSQWTPIPSTYDPKTSTVSGRTNHLSLWSVIQVDPAALATLVNSLYPVSATVDPAPTLDCPQPGTASDVQVDAPSNGFADYCVGRTKDGGVLLRVANLRSYSVQAFFPKAWPMTILNPAQPWADQLLTWGAEHVTATSAGDTVRIIPGGSVAEFKLPSGSHGRVLVQPSPAAYLIDISIYAMETASLVLGKLPWVPKDASSVGKLLARAMAAKGCLAGMNRTLQATISSDRDWADFIITAESAALDCATDAIEAEQDVLLSSVVFVVQVLAWAWSGVVLSARGFAAAYDTLARRYELTIATPLNPVKDPRLSTAGYGLLHFGMTVAAAQRALGKPLTADAGQAGEGCTTYTSDAAPRLVFAEQGGRIVAAGVPGGPGSQKILTPSGLHVGSTLTELLGAVPGMTHQPYASAPGYTEYDVTASSGQAASFEVDDTSKTVTSMSVGSPGLVVGVEFLCA